MELILRPKIIWITWEKQRRNEGLSRGVGAKLYELLSDKGKLFRYLNLAKLTLKIIYKERPDVVVAQNPSIILALLVVLNKKIFRYKAVIDAHNSGIFPYQSKSKLLNGLSRFIQKKACLTVVTNQNLCTHVNNNRGKGFVLPDRIPTPPNPKKIFLEGDNKIVFICTYSSDEPYMEVIKAAKHLGNEYKIYFTGNYIGKVDVNLLPANVALLGYLPEESYWDLLNSSDVIMDLTSREDCLVCGAYEAIALNKPLILSNTSINRDFFNIGCVYVDSNYQSIYAGILEIFSKYRQYHNQIDTLKKLLEEEWERKRVDFLKELIF